MLNKKLFVGGYYDDRIFEGDVFEEKTPFNNEIDTYTLDEVLELTFVENVVFWYEDNFNENWDDASYFVKVKAIEKYTESDEIAGILFFETEDKAETYKQEVLNEIMTIEESAEYVGQKQDQYSYYRDVYKLKEEE